MGRTKISLMAGTSLLVALGAFTAQATTPQEAARKRLIEAVTVPGIHKHLEAFARIAAKNNGTRASGTRGYGGSANYVAARLREAGYRVQIQPFDYAYFEETGDPTLARVSPSPQAFTAGTDFLTMEYSAAGALTGGRLVPTNDILIPPPAEPGSTSGCEPADFPPPPAAGSIALIQRGTCDFSQKALNAAAAGYAGALIFNEGQPGRDELLAGTLGAEVPVPIPVLGLTFALGRTLYTQATTGPVTASLSVEAFTEERSTRNVIANTPGGRNDRVIVVGAHLDSVAEGPGINDNGSGSATILEVARQMTRLNLKNKNQVRFAFWGAEEAGLVGSTYYVGNLTEQQANKIEMNLNFDMLASPNFVRLVYDGDGSLTPDDPDAAGPPGSEVIERAFNKYFASRGLPTQPTAFDGRSDYGPFIDVGIPAGGLFSGAEEIKTAKQARLFGGRAGVALDPCYHQACDDIDNISRTSLNQMSDAVASTVAEFAYRSKPLVPVAAKMASAKLAATQKRQYLYLGGHLQR